MSADDKYLIDAEAIRKRHEAQQEVDALARHMTNAGVFATVVTAAIYGINALLT